MEITPINPNTPVLAPLKVERDESQKRNPPKQPPKQDNAKAEADQQPAEHIDEIV